MTSHVGLCIYLTCLLVRARISHWFIGSLSFFCELPFQTFHLFFLVLLKLSFEKSVLQVFSSLIQGHSKLQLLFKSRFLILIRWYLSFPLTVYILTSNYSLHWSHKKHCSILYSRQVSLASHIFLMLSGTDFCRVWVRFWFIGLLLLFGFVFPCWELNLRPSRLSCKLLVHIFLVPACACTCVSSCVTHTCRSPQKLEEGIRFAETGVIGNCELPRGC